MTSRYERALVAIGRLDGLLQHYPLLSAWWYRAQLETAIRLVEIEGYKVDAERLLGQLIGIAPPIRDGGTSARALRVLRTLQERWPRREGDAVDDDQAGHVRGALTCMRRALDGQGGLRAAVDGMWLWLEQDGLRVPGHLALGQFLYETHVISAPWPCLVGAPLRPMAGQGRAVWTDAVFDGLAYEAGRGLAKALDLRLAWRSWRRALGRRRRGSNFERVLELATALPAITPRLAAEELGCTVAGAGKLLDELKRARILAEVSGRGSWKCYVTRDLEAVRQFNRREGLDARAVLWPEPAPEVVQRREHDAQQHFLQPLPVRSWAETEDDEVGVDLTGLLAQLERKTASVALLVDHSPASAPRPVSIAEFDDDDPA